MNAASGVSASSHTASDCWFENFLRYRPNVLTSSFAQRLASRGAQIVVDTCNYITPVLKQIKDW
jgi:hypothetical protein